MSSTCLHVLSQPLSKTQDSFVLRKIFQCENFPMPSSVRLLIQKQFLALDEARKKTFVHRSPDTISAERFKFGELGGHCFFWIICRQFAWRHCWATHAVCTEPHASRWICRSVWQRSAAVFSKLWKQKLINIYKYCSQQHHHQSCITVTSLSCQGDTTFCWNKRELVNRQ